MVTSRLSWAAAGRNCRRINSNAHLLVVNDAAEQSAIADMLSSYTSSLYKFLFCFVYYARLRSDLDRSRDSGIGML